MISEPVVSKNPVQAIHQNKKEEEYKEEETNEEEEGAIDLDVRVDDGMRYQDMLESDLIKDKDWIFTMMKESEIYFKDTITLKLTNFNFEGCCFKFLELIQSIIDIGFERIEFKNCILPNFEKDVLDSFEFSPPDFRDRSLYAMTFINCKTEASIQSSLIHKFYAQFDHKNPMNSVKLQPDKNLKSSKFSLSSKSPNRSKSSLGSKSSLSSESSLSSYFTPSQNIGQQISTFVQTKGLSLVLMTEKTGKQMRKSVEREVRESFSSEGSWTNAGILMIKVVECGLDEDMVDQMCEELWHLDNVCIKQEGLELQEVCERHNNLTVLQS